MRAIVTLALKDLRLLVRDKMGLFWMMVFPLLMALFFGAIFGGEGGGARQLKIATLKENVSPVAEKFYETLRNSAALNVRALSRDSAQMQVKRGQLVAFVEFRTRAENTYQLFGDDSTSIEVGIDPARKAEAGFLNGLINQAYFTLIQSAMSDTQGLQRNLRAGIASLDSSTQLAENNRRVYRRFYSSLDSFLGTLDSVNSLDTSRDSGSAALAGFGSPNIHFQDVAISTAHPRSSFEITFPQSLQWALIGTAAAFGLSIVIERTRGTFLRLRLAPVSRAQILAGKALACFIASTTVSVVLMLIGITIFNVHIAFPLGLALAIGCAAICFVGLMMLVSVLGKTEGAVAGTGWGIFLVFSMIGGGMVPLMMMPPWMATLSNFSPIKWSILAVEGAIWRGFTLAEMLTPLFVLCGIGVAGYLIGVSILSRSDG